MTRFAALALLGLAPLGSLTLTACVTPSAEEQPEARKERSPCEYYPLAVGNRWVYDSPQPDGSTQTVTVAISGVSNGYYQDNMNGSLACTPGGVRDAKRYLLESPLEKGHSWKAVTGVGTTEVFTIEEVGAPVTVPAGTFTETVTVRSQARIDANRVLELETVYARGLGMVRIQTRLLEGGKAIPQITALLREFKPAAPAAAPAAAAEPPKS